MRGSSSPARFSGADVATYSARQLSASTNGRPIPLATIASPGDLIHTATATAGELDEVYLWATNTDAAAQTLTIELGGTTAGDRIVNAVSFPANSQPIQIVPGIRMSNAAEVRAFCSLAGAFVITGYVNRITP